MTQSYKSEAPNENQTHYSKIYHSRAFPSVWHKTTLVKYTIGLQDELAKHYIIILHLKVTSLDHIVIKSWKFKMNFVTRGNAG